MSELHRDLAEVLEAHRWRNLPKTWQGIGKTALQKARDGDPTGLLEELPKLLEIAVDDATQRYKAGVAADAEFDRDAANLAAAHDLDELHAMRNKHEARTHRLSRQHEASLRRMGSGNRPTGGAVAGEAARNGFKTQRLLAAAIRLKENS